MEGANPDRAATLALFHDTQESRTGDIPSVGKKYLTPIPPRQITEDQVADLPSVVADSVCALVCEYEDRETAEAKVAKDADRLECLLQGREYEAEGYRDVGPWIESMAAAVRTKSGQRMAASAVETAPSEWWMAMVSDYGRAKAEEQIVKVGDIPTPMLSETGSVRC